MTLEEAQAKIVELQEELATTQTERDNYSKRVDDLTKENENVRELNQKYFLKLSAQYKKPDDNPEDEDPDVPTCEDFAKTLTI